MPAIRALSHSVITERLEIYGCRFIRKQDDGSELWETGWGHGFTLRAEPDDTYDEWQYLKLEAAWIAAGRKPKNN